MAAGWLPDLSLPAKMGLAGAGAAVAAGGVMVLVQNEPLAPVQAQASPGLGQAGRSRARSPFATPRVPRPDVRR